MRLMPPNLATQILQPKYATVFFLGTAATFAALAAGLASAAFFLHRKRPLDIIGQWRWVFFAWGLGIWLAVQAALSLIDVLIAPHGFAISASHGSATFALIALIGIMVQAFTEEFHFPGLRDTGIAARIQKTAACRDRQWAAIWFGAYRERSPPDAERHRFWNCLCVDRHPHRRHRIHLRDSRGQQLFRRRGRDIGQRRLQGQPGDHHSNHAATGLVGPLYRARGADRRDVADFQAPIFFNSICSLWVIAVSNGAARVALGPSGTPR